MVEQKLIARVREATGPEPAASALLAARDADETLAPAPLGPPDGALRAPATAPSRSRRTAVSASIALHAGLIAFVLWRAAEPGVTAPPSDVISVELAPTEVTDAVERSDEEAANADAAAAASASAAEPSPATEPPPPEPEPAPEPPQKSPEVASPTEPPAETPPEAHAATPPQEKTDEPAPEPPPAAAPVDEPKPAETPPARAEEKPPERKPAPAPPRTAAPREKLKKPKAEAASTPSAPSSRSRGRGEATGALSARSGEANNYRNLVQARVAANRPGSAGDTGSVSITFAVSASGGLAYARVSRSSGKPALDQAALGAVRRASPFPPPPPGAPRSFTMPFTFNLR